MLYRVTATSGVLALCLVIFSTRSGAALPQTPTPTALRIVVVEGEAAVNVIQQKTATAPIVEVRDRNNQPVSGAVVRFAIQGGRAAFGNASTLSVTTNAAGQAVAAGLTPTASGAIQITATAAFQGQTAAAVTIAQTNVMTAAQAAAISSSAAAGSGGAGAGGTTAGAGGAAGGGGGGLSATTIGVIGGAAGGAIAAKEVLSGQDSVVYSGSYSASVNHTFPASQSFCSRSTAHSGTVEVDIAVNADGTVAGEGSANGMLTMTSFSGAQLCAIATATQNHGNGGPITGTTQAMTFHAEHAGNFGVIATYDFAGALNGDTIVGTFTFRLGTADDFDLGVFPVILQKQQ